MLNALKFVVGGMVQIAVAIVAKVFGKEELGVVVAITGLMVLVGVAVTMIGL